ncbi:MAG: 4a-hydroxytetrahydrobiopterin dehydratase [Bacillota bacterium]
MSRLDDNQIAKQLLSIPKWKLKDENSIVRKYVFKEYLAGIEFVTKIGHLAEEKNHHPFIEIQYKAVFISYTSWAARGLTQLDFDIAKQIDYIYDETL